MFWPYHNNWWGFPGLIFLAGFIFLIVILVKNSQNQQSFNSRNFYHGGNPANESAIDILNKRYAKGEITKEQYNQMKMDMGL